MLNLTNLFSAYALDKPKEKTSRTVRYSPNKRGSTLECGVTQKTHDSYRAAMLNNGEMTNETVACRTDSDKYSSNAILKKLERGGFVQRREDKNWRGRPIYYWTWIGA